jgi:hypothetical protein
VFCGSSGLRGVERRKKLCSYRRSESSEEIEPVSDVRASKVEEDGQSVGEGMINEMKIGFILTEWRE